jgi:hypothetical protein
VTGRPLVRDRDVALYLGLALWVAGSVLLWDAWENRGRPRPLVAKLAGALP